MKSTLTRLHADRALQHLRAQSSGDDTAMVRTKSPRRRLSLRSIALERSTEGRILVREVQDVLRQARSLDDTADLDRAFVLDKLADGVQKIRRELQENWLAFVPKFDRQS